MSMSVSMDYRSSALHTDDRRHRDSHVDTDRQRCRYSSDSRRKRDNVNRIDDSCWEDIDDEKWSMLLLLLPIAMVCMSMCCSMQQYYSTSSMQHNVDSIRLDLMEEMMTMAMWDLSRRLKLVLYVSMVCSRRWDRYRRQSCDDDDRRVWNRLRWMVWCRICWNR